MTDAFKDIDEVYYESSPGEQAGPVTVDVLLKMIKSKQVTGETLIWYGDLPDWESLRSCDLGKALLKAAAPPPPPSPSNNSKPPPPPPGSKKPAAPIAATSPTHTNVVASTSINTDELQDLLESAEMDIQLSMSLVDDNIEVTDSYLQQKANMNKLLQSPEYIALAPLGLKLKTAFQSLDEKAQVLNTSLASYKLESAKLNKKINPNTQKTFDSRFESINSTYTSLKGDARFKSLSGQATSLISSIESIQNASLLRDLLKFFRDLKGKITTDSKLDGLKAQLDAIRSSKSPNGVNDMANKFKQELKQVSTKIDGHINRMSDDLAAKNVTIDNGSLYIGFSDMQIDVSESLQSYNEYIKQLDQIQKLYSSLLTEMKSSGENHDNEKAANNAAVKEVANALKSELKALKSELDVLKKQENTEIGNGSSQSAAKGGAAPSKPPKPARNASVAQSPSSATNNGFGGGGIDDSLSLLPPPPPPPVPISKAKFDGEPSDDPDAIDDIVEIKPNNRTSKRLSDREKKALGSHFQSISSGISDSTRAGDSINLIGSGASKDVRIAFLRKDATTLLNSSGFTVSKLEMIGNEIKRGAMQKKSKILGINKKKWFVLEANRIEYYESREDSLNSNKFKVLLLNAASIVKCLVDENSFSIESLDENGKTQVWTLLTDSENEMLSWIEAINAHIHMQYKRENGIEVDFYDDEDSDINVSFWMVPPTAQNPVGIRTVPFVEGPKSNNGIYPGEIIEVVQKINRGKNTFLRIADDRGWVFEKHPKANYNLLVKCPGTYAVQEAVYEYFNPHGNEFMLTLFAGPSLDSEVLPETITQGTKLQTIASFTPSSAITDDCPFPLKFFKVQSPRGWVLQQDMETGEDVLRLM